MFAAEQFCPLGTIPYAGMADADAFRRVWNTIGEDESEDTKMVPACISSRSIDMFGMELVQTKRKRNDLTRCNKHSIDDR